MIGLPNNPELIKIMQTWQGKMFARKYGIPLSALEFFISDEELIKSLNKCINFKDINEPFFPRSRRSQVDEELYKYYRLDNFPRYWIIAEKENKEKSYRRVSYRTLEKYTKQDRLLRDIYENLEKRIKISVPLNSFIQWENGIAVYSFKWENGREVKLDMTNKKVIYV